MSDLLIRPARVEDAEIIRQMEMVSFTDPWSKDGLVAEIASPLSYCLVAQRDGVIEGYLLARLVLGEGELLRIAVDAAAQARGTGRALTEAMLRDNPGITPWRLDVRQSNYGAIRLYEKLGFKPVARRRDYYEKPVEDGIMMILE